MSKRGTGAVNVQRRTWDKAEYEAKAKERAEREAAGRFSDDEDGAPSTGGGAGAGAGQVHRAAPEGAAGPEGSKRAFLSARDEQLNLEHNLNKRSVSAIARLRIQSLVCLLLMPALSHALSCVCS